MKYVLVALGLVAGNAVACPGDGVKDAMAPPMSKPVVVAKSTPISTPVSTPTQTAAPAKTTKVVAKAPAEPRKPVAQ